MQRDLFVRRLREDEAWDFVVIGGGATGLGVALDAVSRGFSTLLLEQADFAKGTSSRSTKLVHGGVRYLAQGDIKLVYGALHERGLLLKNAAHLVKKQAFIIPCYSWFEKIQYLAGLKIYDLLSGRSSFGKSAFLNREAVMQELPCIQSTGLIGGVKYFDGQFDDARLAINIAQTCAEKGGVLLNYFRVSGLQKKNEKIDEVTATDLESGQEYKIKAKVVVNATGVFVDDILQMDRPGCKPLVRPSQGVHLVFHQSFLPVKQALMIPKTADGRVLFAVPWHEYILVGTTDTPLEKHSLEPVAQESEINFILDTLGKYTTVNPSRKDVLSVFAGLRPLAAPQKNINSTKEISRDHKLIVSDSGLITITGGKWTTYRKMAEHTVDKCIETAGFSAVPCKTEDIAIHGCCVPGTSSPFSVYGTDQQKISALIAENPSLGKKITPSLSYTEAEVIWAVKSEMARTVEDVLARRLRVLFLDARAAIESAPRVAALIAGELHYDKAWENAQVQLFIQLAKQYVAEPLFQKTDMPSNHANSVAM